LACCACEAFSCCFGMSCTLCGATIPFVKSVGTRLAYVLLFGLTVIVAWVFGSYATEILHWVPGVNLCNYNQLCVPSAVVYRVTTALCVFHLLLAVILIGVKNTKDPRAMLQDGFWGLKAALLVGLTVVAFVVPSQFYVGWSYVDLVFAGIFILCQLILLVDFAHGWAESWAHNWEESQAQVWFYGLLVSSLTMFAVAVGGSIAMYVLYSNKYTLNAAFVSANLVLALAYTVMSVHPALQERNNHRGGLLQAAIVALYSTYLVFSAVLYKSEGGAAAAAGSSGNSLSVALGAVFAVLSVCYSAFTASGSSETYSFHASENNAATNSSADTESATLLEKKADEAEDHEGDDEHHEVTYSYTFFHVIFATGAAYVCMLLTAWKMFDPAATASSVQPDSGTAAMWIKIASSWVCVLMYMWTLLAPVLFPDREFH